MLFAVVFSKVACASDINNVSKIPYTTEEMKEWKRNSTYHMKSEHSEQNVGCLKNVATN